MAKMKTLNIKVMGREKIDENSARNLLMSLKGSDGGMMYELKRNIYKGVDLGDKYFLVKFEAAIGGKVAKETALQIQNSINLQFKKAKYEYRVRYAEERLGLVVCPAANYEQIFGKRNHK